MMRPKEKLELGANPIHLPKDFFFPIFQCFRFVCMCCGPSDLMHNILLPPTVRRYHPHLLLSADSRSPSTLGTDGWEVSGSGRCDVTADHRLWSRWRFRIRVWVTGGALIACGHRRGRGQDAKGPMVAAVWTTEEQRDIYFFSKFIL